MNLSASYDNWPLYIETPAVPLEELENNIFGIALITAIGSLFAVPGMIFHYLKSRSRVALVSIMFIRTITCVLAFNMFFDFRSKSISLFSLCHSASEVTFLLFALANGSFQIWHLIVLGAHITLVSFMIVLLSREKGHSNTASDVLVDILFVSLWILAFQESRRNPKSTGQRSGLVLFGVGSCLHLLGASIYGLNSAKGGVLETTLHSALFVIFTIFSVHLTVSETRIIGRFLFDLKWTAVWSK